MPEPDCPYCAPDERCSLCLAREQRDTASPEERISALEQNLDDLAAWLRLVLGAIETLNARIGEWDQR